MLFPLRQTLQKYSKESNPIIEAPIVLFMNMIAVRTSQRYPTSRISETKSRKEFLFLAEKFKVTIQAQKVKTVNNALEIFVNKESEYVMFSKLTSKLNEDEFVGTSSS